MAIPEKLDEVKLTKKSLKDSLESTGQTTTDVTFRNYSGLIENVPNLGTIPQANMNSLVNLAIDISGEKA